MISPHPVSQRNASAPLPASPDDWALFLDVDGTILEFGETPDAVHVTGELRSLLGSLRTRMHGALALVSGRRLDNVDRLFAPLMLPVAGLHGLERRGADGSLHTLGDPGQLDPFRPAVEDFAKSHPGVVVEDKGRGLALHYRQAPAAEAPARQLVAQLFARHGEGLRVIDGKMLLEIKPKLADKGQAIAGFLDERPFQGRRPVFVGDDVTDEDGFRLVNARGGHSVRVGAFEGTNAGYTLPDVGAVLGWLREIAGPSSTRQSDPGATG